MKVTYMCKGGDQHRLEQRVELACVQPAETWARVQMLVEANVLCQQADIRLLNVHQVNVFEHVFQLYGVQQGRLEQRIKLRKTYLEYFSFL
jgi:hypothetical protein